MIFQSLTFIVVQKDLTIHRIAEGDFIYLQLAQLAKFCYSRHAKLKLLCKNIF